jgi:hypothetical protein
MIVRRRFHQTVFLLAGVYNIAWGLYSSWDPQWVFRVTGMEPLNHPEVFACLAMVVGLYGVLYLEVARRPEHGWPLAAVGLAGKVLGPVGMAVAVWRGLWPPSAFVVCLTNDFLWWAPFALYLKDSWRGFRATFGRTAAG